VASKGLYERISDYCFGENFRQTAKAATAFYDKRLGPLGIRSTQYSLLAAIGTSGAASLDEISRLTGTAAATLSRNVDVLEKHGWVEPSPASDRRERRVVLTPAGQALLSRAWGVWKEAQRDLIGIVGIESWKETKAAMVRIRQVLGEMN
jgi:DNA-binding MarR family transcriptional regulator